MKRPIRQKRGQFIIIAVLMIAIMIISISALMHRAATYYAHEPWEEYLTLIGNVELNSYRLVELSLANYTHTLNTDILKNNIEQWQFNLTQIYPGREVTLNYTLASDTGLTLDWNKTASFSAANAIFTLDINSIGLTGYKFTAAAFLKLTILNVNTTSNEITVTVKREDNIPITNLKAANFEVVEPADINITSVTPLYDNNEILVYVIKCGEPITTPVTVTVCDQRGIQVTAKYP